MSESTTWEQRNATVSDAWYPAPDQYWVIPPADDARPSRYGDLYRAPATSATGQPLTSGDGRPWLAVLVLTPSCELISKAKDDAAVEVARVLPLAAQAPKPAAAIVAGWQEQESRVAVAYANMIFLAGVPHAPGHDDGMFADLRQTVRVRLGDLREAGRIAALDHDARVSVIRRELYYRYRWLVATDDVRALEAARISHDPHFTEPRPPWGDLAQ